MNFNLPGGAYSFFVLAIWEFFIEKVFVFVESSLFFDIISVYTYVHIHYKRRENMLSKDIKEYGLRIGYNKVGIAPADCLSEYVKEVISRGAEYDFFQKMLTKPIEKSMPDAKSIIVMVWDYYQKEYPECLKKMIGKIYLSRSYLSPKGTLEDARFQLMKDYLIHNGCKVVEAGFNVPSRWVAAQAGVTTFGKNNFAYTDESGSYIVIHVLLVDKKFEYDEPTMECKCPPNCRACIDACPTKALYKPFHLDPHRCIPYNNWITQEGRKFVTTDIPEEIRPYIGCKIHGCDICQDVCPRNQKKLKAQKPMDLYVECIAEDITLPAILDMSDDFYKDRIYPIMYNYIEDKRYFMRNAAIAIGNSKNKEYIKDLKIALEKNSDKMVRKYILWALEQIEKE